MPAESRTRAKHEPAHQPHRDAQEKRYRRILGYKDQARYGARTSSVEQAERLLRELEEFAVWAEGVL